MVQHNSEEDSGFPQTEILLRRLTTDEALYRLDSYLDEAFMAGLEQVRIVHGKGTGTLKEAIHSYLDGHSLVISYRMGLYGEGGGGVTIAYLAQRRQ